MDTTYDHIRDSLSEVVTGDVHFLPCGNDWSPKRQRDLMHHLEDALIGLKASDRGKDYFGFVPEVMACAVRVSLGRSAEGAIAVEFDNGTTHLIRGAKVGDGFPGLGWMDPGLHGDAHKWRTWIDKTNKLNPDSYGHSIVKFRFNSIPRFVVMALVDAVVLEDQGNRVITTDHPPFSSILWEAFNFAIDREGFDKMIEYNFGVFERRP
jgi:hypothetical protein